MVESNDSRKGERSPGEQRDWIHSIEPWIGLWQLVVGILGVIVACVFGVLVLPPVAEHIFHPAATIRVPASPTPEVSPAPAPLPPTPTPTDTATPTPTQRPTTTPTPTESPTPTFTPTPAPPPTIDTMDNPSGWMPYDDGDSSISVGLTPGRSGNAIEISFDVRQDGWVGISKPIRPDVLGKLSETGGIRFFLKGSGARNTIELKLLYKPNRNGQSAIFSVEWFGATVAGDWEPLEVPYAQFWCWADTGCQPGERLDLEKVWKIDFAISNKAGDIPGRGIVAIDDVAAIE